MIRALLLCFLLGACPALAQHVTGPLQAQNNLSEIAKNGATAQAQARANIGAGSATILWPTVGAVVVSNGTDAPAGINPSGTNCLVSSGTSWTTGPCGGSTGLAIGSTPITGGTTNYLLYNNAGVLANEPVSGLTFDGGQVVSGTVAGTYLAAANLAAGGNGGVTGLLPNANLANPATTVNGVLCTLGLTCTVSASAVSVTIGTTGIVGGATGNVLYNNGGVFGVLSTSGTGGVALTTGPTFIAPILGTPASGNAANITNLPISTGLSGAGTGVIAALQNAVTGSSGGMVLAVSPSIAGLTVTSAFTATGLVTNAGELYYSNGVFVVA